MRLAITSDIHANWQAWSAVLIDIRSQGIDRILCLGDVVGYGPNPAEVMASVHAHVDHFVLGNHDAVICGKMDPSLFNEDAQRMIAWTRARLNADAANFFNRVPLTLAGEGFRCAHGDFAEPGAFNYVIDPADAIASWDAVREPLLFTGHTHTPAIFLRGASGRPHVVPPQDFELEPDKRYLVNVGSVGHSRDHDTRASYCVFDTDARSICWRRIPFDLDAYRDAMQRAGLATAGSHLLRHDPRQASPPLREQLSFSPATSHAQQVRDTVAVETLGTLRREARRWKTLALAGVVVLVVAGIVTALGMRRFTHRERVIPAAFAVISAGMAANLVAEPDAPTAAGTAVPGWEVRLGDGRHQSVRVVPDSADALCFRLDSTSARDDLRLISTPVAVRPGQRLQLQGLVRPGPGYEGTVALYLSVTRRVDGRDVVDPLYLVKKPEWQQPDGWLKSQATAKALPPDATHASLELRARFTGTLDARDLTLTRRAP